MGKNVYIGSGDMPMKNMTHEEQEIGDFRGWWTVGDFFLEKSEPRYPEAKELEEKMGDSYYAGPYVPPGGHLRDLLPDARVFAETHHLEDSWEWVEEFVELWERMVDEGRDPTLWICI